MKIKKLKWFSLLFFGLAGCYDFSQFDNIAVDPINSSYVFPLMKSKITFKELAEKGGTNTVAEQHPGSNIYYLEFRDTLNDIGSTSELFPSIPSTPPYSSNFQIVAGDIPGLNIGDPLLITKSFDQNYTTFPGAELKEVLLSGGTLLISLTNNFNHPINGNITITSLENAAHAPLIINFPIAGIAAGASFPIENDLSGYFLNLYQGATYNTMRYAVTASFTYTGAASITGGVDVQLSINNPIYQRITGKLTYSFDLPDQSYSIGIFKSTILAQQHLAEPKFSLKFINGYGLPTNISFTRFEVEKYNGDLFSLQSNRTNSGDLQIGAASHNNLKAATLSLPGDTTLVLNSANSNIQDLFDYTPKSISYDATFNIGNAADPSHDYFINSDSKFILQSEIEIPLSGWVITNKIADTIENMDWPDLKKDLDPIKVDSAKIKLKFKFSNELPLDMYFQAYFLNSTGVIVDSLLNGAKWLLKSAPINSITGETYGATENWEYIEMDKEKYDSISSSTNMVIIYKFKTGGADNLPPQNITILSTNSIALDMSIEVKTYLKFKQ